MTDKSQPYRVMEASAPLFMDAYALQDGRWVFGSFWGHETVLQEFLARLTLGNHEQGLRSFTLESPDGMQVKINAGNVDALTKASAKTPPTTVLGSLCNLWVFDPALQRPDRAIGEAYVLGREQESSQYFNDRIWSAIQSLSQLPLLDSWRDFCLQVFNNNKWITELVGMGVSGYRVTIPAAEFELLVSNAIRSRAIGVDDLDSRDLTNSEPCNTDLQGQLF